MATDEEQSAAFASALWVAMQEQEAKDITGEEKREAVKAILFDTFGDVFGAKPWMKGIIDSVISLLVEVDSSDQTLNLKGFGCGCLPWKKSN